MIEDDNEEGNKEDKGRMEALENGCGETAASRAREGSLHSPLSGIRISLRLSHLCLEAEEREVTILASKSEAAGGGYGGGE